MNRALGGCVAATMLLALPVQASTINATAATLAAAFASAKAGDTIKLSGSFGATYFSNRTFSSVVTIDARAATFTGTLAIVKVGGLKVLGGQYGSDTALVTPAIRVNTSDRITFSKPVVSGNGTSAHGIDVGGSTKITVDGGSFTGLRSGVAFTGVTQGLITHSTSVRSASDGFDIADSHKINITFNSCSDTRMTPGAHPDCVQLWSIAGHPRQSDIMISDNIATGPTQGFSSFNADDGGGLRISMLRNRVDTSWSEGIACYNCDYSVFKDNVLTTQPGALYQTKVHIVGGSHNTASGNSVAPYVRPANTAVSGADDLTLMFDKANTVDFTQVDFPLSESGFNDAVLSTVPEPGVWAMLIAGFGLAGVALRRRRVLA